MGEVLVAAIGALGGFLAAFAAEPIKTYFTGLSEKRRLRNAIYREIGYSYYNWEQFFATFFSNEQHTSLRTSLLVLSNITEINRNDSYQYAKSQPFLFYALPEAVTIDSIYSNFRLLRGLEDLDLEHMRDSMTPEEVAARVREFAGIQIESAKAGVKAFETNLRDGEINTQLLLEIVPDRHKQLLAQTLETPQRSIVPD